ncbi:MAG: tripartite tricarboxylate transporter substrate binding protein [Rubritepida sp.]|nr:tripartite tricarboxylate transporter substrate binding protein [Rubritepida sp.]
MHRSIPRRTLGAGTLAVAALAARPALAWPDRPVTIISPFGPGASQDVLARLLAPKLMAAWGQPVVVQNVTGAAGTIGVDRVAKAAPDGHTLVLSGDAAIVVRVSMSPRPPYDPVRDLAPISLLGRTPNVLVVGPSIPARNVQELVAMARARPGSVTFGHAGPGTSQHIGGELLAQMAGVEMTGVAYNDPAAQIQDVLTGRVTFSFNSGVVSLPRVRDGAWRGLAVSSPQRMAAAPDIPTVAEQGYPGFDATAWLGLFAPAGTPAPAIARIHRDVTAAMGEPDVRARLADLGVEFVASDPEALRDLIGREIPRMAGILQRAGIRPE